MLEIAIIGAGPYGLSLAAHIRRSGIPFRVFGRSMDSWLAHMPKGMLLKSDGFASNISDPDRQFTLKQFCIERGIEFSERGIPVRLETFSAYGLAFRDRMVPELENKLLVSLECVPRGFRLQLDDGQTLTAERVVLAVGITHFAHTPANIAHLPKQYLSHSFQHHDLEAFRGRNVVVLGAGSSAIDLVSLLSECGANVQLVARAPALQFHEQLPSGKRSLWEQIRRPKSGLGPGLRSRFFADAPWAFRYFPERFRLETVRTFLGPAGGWFAKERVLGRVPLQLGCAIESADVRDRRVHLRLRGLDGSEREISTDHLIAATGYKVDLERLKFLSDELRSKIKAVNRTPILSSNFESSIPGLYFTGIAAASSFGPAMRFAYGADFAARRITRDVAKVLSHARAPLAATSVITTAK